MIPEARDRHAGLRPDRRGALGGVRRVRRARAGHPDRRRRAEGDRLGVVRHRGQPGHRIQADPRPGHQAGAGTSRIAAWSCSGQGDAATRPQGATWTGPRRWPTPNPRTACRSRRPIPSTSCTPPGPPARPKGVVRDNGGHAVALRWTMPNIYDTGPGEVFWAASDVGWVVGHSYIVYAPLLTGCTTVLYEGKPVGTPDAGAFWRVVAEHNVEDAVHRADRIPRDQEGGPGGQAGRASTTCPGSGTCSWPGSGWTRRPTGGRGSCSASRSSTTGGRPRPAGRSPRT